MRWVYVGWKDLTQFDGLALDDIYSSLFQTEKGSARTVRLNILRTVVLAALVLGGGLVKSVLGYEPENYLLESMPRPPEDVREV